MNLKIVFGLLVILFFSGCTTLDPPMWIDDANYYSTDLNVDDANFTNLNDTPVNYVGSGNQCVAVNAGETGLEFIVCAASGLPDTTLDVNINALFNFLGKSYDWNKDQNFLSSNIFDLNLGKDSFAVNGIDFNVFDLNISVLSECSGDSNHVLTSANLCQFIGGYGTGGSGGVGDGNFYSIQDHNILFAKIADVNENFLLIADSNDFSRLFYDVIADFNIAVLNSNDWNGLGIDSNCSVSGSCPLIAYKDRDEIITGDANWTLTNTLRTNIIQPYQRGEIGGASIGTSKYRFNNSYYTENLFNVANCQVGGCSSEVGYFYLEPNAGVDQNNFFIDFSAFKNIVNVVSDPYQLILYDSDYAKRWYVDANGNSWFDGNVSIDLNLLVDGNTFTECLFFKDGTSLCTNNFLTVDANVDSNKVKFGVAAGSVELNDLNNLTAIVQSSGYYSGGDFSDNADGSITVSAGMGLIRETNVGISEVMFFSWDANALVGLIDEQANYISIDFNGGLPYVRSSTTSVANGKSIFNLGLVFREGTEAHLFKAGQNIINLMQRVQARINAEGSIVLTSGGNVVEKEERNLTVTEATLYGGLTKFTTTAIDTNGTGIDDIFEYYYTDGIGGWQFLEEDANKISNTQYDNAGSLDALGSNKYRTDWIYLCNDGDLMVILGTNNSATLSAAQNINPPTSFPSRIQHFSTLIAKVIAREGQDNLIEVDNLAGTVFTSSGAINHNDLSGLQGGQAEEYYHLTEYLNELINDFNLSVETATNIFSRVTDVNGNFALILDVNGADNLRALILDVNGADNLRALITDVNGADSLRALITDVNGADNLRALITDVNGADTLRALITDVNGADELRILATDANLWFWKSEDLNLLLQIPDFNNMIVNLGESEGWNAGGTDSNVWSEGFLNNYNAFNFDVNAQDKNGYFEAISIGNGVSPINTDHKRGILVGGDVTKGITLSDNQTSYRALSSEATVNTTASLNDVFGYYSGVTLKGANAVNNLIGACGKALVSSVIFTDTLTNLIGLRATIEITEATVTNAFGLLVDDVSGATNNYAIKTGLGEVSFGDDVNLNENNIVNVNDFNGQQIYIETGDMNFFVFDKNVIAQTSLGKTFMNPDKNEMCIGTETVFCMNLTCNATGDCNANFEFI